MTHAVRKTLVAAALGATALGCLAAALAVPGTPAKAQLTVFDPNNYRQNLLTAARTLSQIDNQIRSLQNEAAMLADQAKNLRTIDFPELGQLRQKLEAIARLMGQAQGIDFSIDGLDPALERLFPTVSGKAGSATQRIAEARARLEAAAAGFRHTMRVQAQIVANVQSDAGALGAIVARSQAAEGGLQAQQAANQLLALTAKQQLQIQQMMAAYYRADALEAARRAQAEAEGRLSTRTFLGTGSAYTPR